MNDNKKFKILTFFSIFLIMCILSYNIFQEYITTDIGGYFKRRAYYEKVILEKGLTLHKAKYWKKIDE